VSGVAVSELSIYPVKACQGISVDAVEITKTGVVGDRLFMLSADAELMDQIKTPQMAALAVEWASDEGRLTFTHPEKGRFEHIARDTGPTLPSKLALDSFEVRDQGDQVADWLSSALGKSARLVSAMEPWSKVLPLPQFELIHQTPTERFCAVSPVSLSNVASLDDLNAKLAKPVPMDRFRMNVVVDGLEAYGEDRIVSLASDSVELLRVTVCERCLITNTDQRTGEHVKSDLLPTLNKYRRRKQDRFASGLMFGAYMAVAKEGILRVGDRLTVEY
jgi:uncharacterized protein YcbX